MQPESIREQMVPVSINRLWGQDLLIGDQDLTLTIDRFGERYIEPAVAIVANMIDGEGLDQFGGVYNFVGTPGTIPSGATGLTTYATANAVLANHAVPAGNMRSAIVSPTMEVQILGFGANLFNPAKEISEQYRMGKMGTALGLKFSMDQNVSRQTVGALGTAGNIASAPVVDGNNQTGATLNIRGLDHNVNNIFLQNDIIAIANVNGVNPVSYRDFGSLRTFVITANVNSDNNGKAALPISPAISADATSQFQTVTALPVDGAVISVYGVLAANFNNIANVSAAQGWVFHKDAITVAIVPLELPGGLDWSERISNPKIGISMRLLRGFDIKENQRYTRIDVLGGWKLLRPEMAVRVQG